VNRPSGEGDTDPSPPPLRARLLARFDRILDAALALTVLVASVTIFAQVVLRYIFNSPIAWADEFAVLVFAWMIFIGAAVVQRTDSHLAMDTFVRLLPARAQRAAYLLRVGAIAGVLGVLFVQGLTLAERFGGLKYPAMGISRGYLYATLPVCVPLIAIYLVRSLVRALRERANPTASAVREGR
jgi:TRAP-type C4-dicarboxylate transport system permease small subunit